MINFHSGFGRSSEMTMAAAIRPPFFRSDNLRLYWQTLSVDKIAIPSVRIRFRPDPVTLELQKRPPKIGDRGLLKSSSLGRKSGTGRDSFD